MIVIGFFSCYTDGLNAMDNVVCYRRMLSSCIALKNFRIIFSDFMISSTRCFFIWSSAKFSMTCRNKTCPANSAVLINWVQLHLNWFTAAVKSLQFERLFSLTAAVISHFCNKLYIRYTHTSQYRNNLKSCQFTFLSNLCRSNFTYHPFKVSCVFLCRTPQHYKGRTLPSNLK